MPSLLDRREALAGVDRLFLATGYTVAMVHQSKTIVDAAADAGAATVVHNRGPQIASDRLGPFGRRAGCLAATFLHRLPSHGVASPKFLDT